MFELSVIVTETLSGSTLRPCFSASPMSSLIPESVVCLSILTVSRNAGNFELCLNFFGSFRIRVRVRAIEK